MNLNNNNISGLILRYMAGVCTEEEKKQVNSWLENPDNREFYERLIVQKASSVYEMKDYDYENNFRNFKKAIATRKTNVYRYIISAACVAVLVSSYLVFFRGETENKPEQLSQRKESTVVVMADNGSQTILSSKDTLSLKWVKDTIVTTVNNKRVESLSDNTVRYNTVTVPKNCNFYIVLSDNTKVWLNADTKFRYPTKFTDSDRKVHLDGEAFFDVSKDKQHPFIVNSSNFNVRVLGTQFNVKDYTGEQKAVTLVEGSVQANDVKIKPGEQAYMNGSKVDVKEVDTFIYTSWKDGYFVFYDTYLDDIMLKLSRWYDFEFFYQNQELKYKKFTVRINKDENPEKVMKLLEETGEVQFRIKNNSIIVYAKK